MNLYNEKGEIVGLNEVIEWFLEHYEGLEHTTYGGKTNPETWYTITAILRMGGSMSIKFGKVSFSKLTKFLGRNGKFMCSGIEIANIGGGEMEIQPLTSKGHIGRCMIRIPHKDIPELIRTLVKTAEYDIKDVLPKDEIIF